MKSLFEQQSESIVSAVTELQDELKSALDELVLSTSSDLGDISNNIDTVERVLCRLVGDPNRYGKKWASDLISDLACDWDRDVERIPKLEAEIAALTKRVEELEDELASHEKEDDER